MLLCDLPSLCMFRSLSLRRGGVAEQPALDKEQQKLKMQEEAAAIKARMDEELRQMEEELEEQVLLSQLWRNVGASEVTEGRCELAPGCSCSCSTHV